MNLLAVDTSAETLSIALLTGQDGKEKILAYHKKLSKPHDETLLPAVKRLLKRAGISAGALTAIAAASGPGRFTGIRIGMAYAAVLAGQLKIPALAVTRFHSVVNDIRSDKACAVIDGFRGEKFYQLFERKDGLLVPSGEPVWIGPDDWKVKRGGFEKEGIAIAEGEPAASGLLPAARALLGQPNSFEPLYLKPAGYENKTGKRL